MAIDPSILLNIRGANAAKALQGVDFGAIGRNIGQGVNKAKAAGEKKEAQSYKEVLAKISDNDFEGAQAQITSDFDEGDQALLTDAFANNKTEVLKEFGRQADKVLGLDEVSDRERFDLDERKVSALEGKAKKGAGVGTVSPKDFTVESLAEYAQSGKIDDLVRFQPQVKEIAGVPHQYNPESLRWEPLLSAADPNLKREATLTAELAAEKQSKLDFAKQKSTFQGKESQILGQINSSESKQALMDTTISEIKSLASGWSTQFGTSLSLLPGSEARKLKGLLNTVKANSAFGTLSDLKATGGTLGAISAPELELLSAALGTVDQGGDITELFRVLDQISATNQGSVNRLKNGFNMDRNKFGSSFEEATKPPRSESDLLNQYGVTQ